MAIWVQLQIGFFHSLISSSQTNKKMSYNSRTLYGNLFEVGNDKSICLETIHMLVIINMTVKWVITAKIELFLSLLFVLNLKLTLQGLYKDILQMKHLLIFEIMMQTKDHCKNLKKKLIAYFSTQGRL